MKKFNSARERALVMAHWSRVESFTYKSKRSQRIYWQKLNRDEWVNFCGLMAAWFAEKAPSEFDEFVEANKLRKAASDAAALVRKDQQ